MKAFAVTLDRQSAFQRALLVDNNLQSVDPALRFDLFSEKVPEFVVCVRYTRGTIHTKVLRVQLQTNLGRCSKWFGEYSTVDGSEVFAEVFADPPGTAVVEVKVHETPAVGVTLRTEKAPPSKPLKRRSFLGIVAKSVSTLKEDSEGRESVYHKASAGKLKKKLPIMKPALLSSQPSLLRLLAQDAAPCSVLEMLTKRGKTYDSTLMDLLVLHEPNESIASMACEKSPILKTTILKACLKSTKRHPWSLTRLMLTPNFARGDRSVMQLLTDDEYSDDIERPSILRMLLFQEDRKESLLRLLLLRNPVLGSSISEIIMEGEGSSRGFSIARMALESNRDSGRLARFLTDSPISGKPALAKYLFAGARNSIAAKVLYGEQEGKYSLLRLLLVRKPNKTAEYGFDPSLADVLGWKKKTADAISMLDQMIQDNESGVNLARITFETTCRIKSGMLETFVQPDRTPSLLENGSILSDSGCTLAHLFLSGERDNLFSLLRALLVGESHSSSPHEITSVLRLMCENCEDGKPNMFQIFLHELSELFGNKKHAGKTTVRRGSAATPSSPSGTVQVTSQLSPQAFLPLILKISNRLTQLGPEFAKRWSNSWQFVSEQVLSTVDKDKSSKEWKRTGPIWAKICILVGRRRWSRALFKFARIAQILDQGHGNRFMLTQRVAAKVAKAGVSTGFGISRGIIKAVSTALPIPVASSALDGVNEVLGFAEGVTHIGIDAATKFGMGATGLAMHMKKKSSGAGGKKSSSEIPDEDDVDEGLDEEKDDDDDDGTDDEDEQILRALSVAFGEDDEDAHH